MECRIPSQHDWRSLFPLRHADVPQFPTYCYCVLRWKARIHQRKSGQHVRHLGLRHNKDVCWNTHHVTCTTHSYPGRLPFNWFLKQTFRVLPVLFDSCAYGSGCYRYGLLLVQCFQLWNSSSRLCSNYEPSTKSTWRLHAQPGID